MKRTDTTSRRGIRACACAALLSVLLPGSGHWIIRARFRRAVVAAAVLNLLGTIGLIGVAQGVRNRSDLALAPQAATGLG